MGNENIEQLLNSTAAATGKDRAQLDALLAGNPQLRAMLSKLQPADVARLSSVMSDPEQARRLLNTPQARKLLGSMNTGGQDKKS